MSDTVVTVLVCGGRQYSDRQKVFDALDGIKAECERMYIVEGGCRGADALARKWALSQPITEWVSWSTYEADWKLHGKAAGPIRNQRMLDESKPDLVIAFGGHAGTNDMLKRARKAGVKIVEVDREQPK